MLDHVRQIFDEQDVVDWLLVQIHIAENLAKNIRDMQLLSALAGTADCWWRESPDHRIDRF